MLAVNTGMRKGDLLSLRWSQIDFGRGLIFVPNIKGGEGRGHHLPMSSVVRQTLLDLARHQKGAAVFGLADVKKAFAGACKEAKIEGLRFHDLRHTAATRLADVGADAFTIAAILGHSSIQMSARYTHATDERKRRVLEAIAGRQENPVTIRSQQKSGTR